MQGSPTFWGREGGGPVSSLQLLSLSCSLWHLPKERRSDMAHHPTFRKIYCDAVPYLFKKVRHSLGTFSS